MVRFGIIGGSGLDDLDIIENCERMEVDTPYGSPCSDIMAGLINDVEVLIWPDMAADTSLALPR